MKEYKSAVKAFKKLLENSWKTNNKTQEIEAYDALSIQYFYLGDIERSKYYHDRAITGSIEPKESKIRTIYSSIEMSRSIGSIEIYFKPHDRNMIFDLFDSIADLYVNKSFNYLKSEIHSTYQAKLKSL